VNSIYVKSLAARAITNPTRRNMMRKLNEVKRRVRGREHELHYFHRIDDPYSHLMLQILSRFIGKYKVSLIPHVVSRIDPDMVPDADLQNSYAVRDCLLLAARYNLRFDPASHRISTPEVEAMAASLLMSPKPVEFIRKALNFGDRYWSGKGGATETTPTVELNELRKQEVLLKRMGHYLSASLYYAGEWYWGLDRLHYLEKRLSDLNLDVQPDAQILGSGKILTSVLAEPYNEGLKYYFSARSPYSYIGYFRAREFTSRRGVELDLKPVLPMMMRGMKVPSIKRMYILKDAKREAENLGLPFGNIADPLGAGVERIYAVAHYAKEIGRLPAFLDVCFPAVFARGIDVAKDQGLRSVCEKTGLDWKQVKSALKDRNWQSWVEDNRIAMFSTGCWGVPVFQFGDRAVWGQDRFWVVEDQFRSNR